ncbi:hypothetical protein PSAL_001010 [Pseudooceanicola algae]|uniref:VWFA domain-containing protein n=2 Tax=Pseudooceanicola algae TaxID=1537215 RepID=A0A418SH49_9RHOB|nr:DUF1194 domain-containing protein [Pseudooceanicola algae]QPM88898.1 hypothetical protein PSAL_001010 [Pseudooceanicola algae]
MLCSHGVQAQEQTGEAPCRLALVLALDVSASVDAEEYVLQRDGLAAALLLPEIRQAVLNGGGPVALAAYEWSGRQQQAIILPWTLLRSEGDLMRAASQIASAQRSHTGFPTASGYALGFGAGMLTRAPQCDRAVLDLSGDGINNEGFGPDLAYANFPFAGVVVNGLAILGPDDGVYDFYRDQVLHGPGAFLEIARGFEDFGQAMGLKLFREINDLQIGSDQIKAPGCCG